VSDYDQPTQAGIKTAIASVPGVTVAAVSLDISPGSVIITATIVVPAAQAASIVDALSASMFSSPGALQAALSSAGVVGITVEAILTAPMSDSRASAASPPTPPLPPTGGGPGGLLDLDDLDEGRSDDLREEQGGAKIGGGSIAAIVVCVVLAVCLLGAGSYKIILRKRSAARVQVRKPQPIRTKGKIEDWLLSPKSGVSVEPDHPTRRPLQPALVSPIRRSIVSTLDHLSPETTEGDMVSIRLDDVHAKVSRRDSAASAEGDMVSITLDDVHVKVSRRASAAGLAAASKAVVSTRLSTRAMPGSPLRGMHKTAVVEVDGKAPPSYTPSPAATDAGPGEESRVPIDSSSPAGLRGFSDLSPDEPSNVYDPV